MGKKKREEKLKRQQQTTKPLNWSELFRLMPGVLLRAFVIILPLSILMTFLGGSGLTLFNNVIVQMGTVLAAYLIFNNFIFGPIRKYRRAEAVQKPEPAKKIEPAKAKKPEPSKKPSASKPK